METGVFGTLQVTAPIFALIALGYAAVRLNVMHRDGVRALSAFVVNFALPALIFKALSERTFSDIVHPRYLLVYGLGSLIAFGAVFGITRVLGRKDPTTSAVFAMGASCSNSIMIGYPLVLQLFGTAATVPFALTLMVENFIMIPLALALADAGRGSDAGPAGRARSTAGALARNPIIWGIALGLLGSATGVRAPEAAARAVDMLATSVSGVALFAIGGMLVGLDVKGMAQDIGRIMVGKLLLHPLAVLAVALALPPMEPMLQATALVMASMPMFSIFPVLGQRYGLGPVCAAALVLATVASFVTVNAAMWLLGSLPPH